MSAIAVIPARAGSRRIPHKNRMSFHGRPIIEYSIEAAWESALFSRVVVSTDDEETGNVAERLGCTILCRHALLCRNEVGTQEVARDALLYFSLDGAEYACCIYATAPLMNANDLCVGFACLRNMKAMPFVYVPGWYYWGHTKHFVDRRSLDEGLRVRVKGSRWIDIDTPEDWNRAEQMYAAIHGIPA